MAKYKEQARILGQERLAGDIYSLWIGTAAAHSAAAGQFMALYCRDGGRLLPRPISICDIDREKTALRLVYRIAGKGTAEFSQLREGDRIDVMGALGNGFPLEGKRPVLVGGGIGIPPMLALAKALTESGKERPVIVLGYRSAELFLAEELRELGEVVIATDDGSAGIKGTVVDAMKARGIGGDVLYACGPRPMLAGVRDYAKARGIRCYVSMEERMACGIGACLGCVCQTAAVDQHTNVRNARVCKDGPVFLAEEVEL